MKEPTDEYTAIAEFFKELTIREEEIKRYSYPSFTIPFDLLKQAARNLFAKGVLIGRTNAGVDYYSHKEKAIKQAARNLYNKAIRKDFINRVDSKLKADEKKCKDCMVHYRKMSPLYKKHSVEIEEEKQKTASAIFADIEAKERSWYDTSCGHKVLAVKAVEFDRLKKKHLGE